MKLAVQLFARARDLAGVGQVELELAEPASVADVRAALAESVPALAPLATRLLVAVGNEYADDAFPVAEEDKVVCFPPVSGG